MKRQGNLEEAKYLSVIGLAVLIFGFFAFKGIVGTPPPVSERLSGGGRVPASVAQPFGETKDLQTRLETLVWDCGDLPLPSQLEGSHVRLKSRFCEKNPPQKLRILNTSNGYTASVFLSTQGFSTDFIELQPGENRIQIQWENEHRQGSQREIRLQRTPASESEAVLKGSAD